MKSRTFRKKLKMVVTIIGCSILAFILGFCAFQYNETLLNNCIEEGNSPTVCYLLVYGD